VGHEAQYIDYRSDNCQKPDQACPENSFGYFPFCLLNFKLEPVDFIFNRLFSSKTVITFIVSGFHRFISSLHQLLCLRLRKM